MKFFSYTVLLQCHYYDCYRRTHFCAEKYKVEGLLKLVIVLLNDDQFASLRPPTSSDAGLYSPTEVSSPDIPALEESFTIYLGQSSHNNLTTNPRWRGTSNTDVFNFAYLFGISP